MWEKAIDRAWRWLVWHLPKQFMMFCAIRVIAEATTGKYGDTVVPELPAMEAVARFCRIHAIPGSGADEHWDSNRRVK